MVLGRRCQACRKYMNTFRRRWGQVWIVFGAVLTSFSLSDILVEGCVFLPPVMDLTAPILYHILECGFESTNLEGEKSECFIRRL